MNNKILTKINFEVNIFKTLRRMNVIQSDLVYYLNVTFIMKYYMLTLIDCSFNLNKVGHGFE